MHLTFCIYSFLTLFNFYSSTCTDDVIQWYRPSRALNLSYVLAAYEGTIFTNTIPPFLSGVEEVDSLNLSDDDNISSIQKKADRISFPSTPSIRSYRHPSEFRTVHKRKFSVSPTSFIETNLKQKNKKSSENLNLISENQVYHLLPQDSNQVWIYVLKREISSIPLIFYQAFNCLIFISLSGYFSILGLTKWKCCFVFLFNLSFYRPKLLHYVPTIDGSIGTLQIPLSPSLFFHPVCGIFTDIRYISLVVLLLLVTMFNTAIQQKHLPYTMTATPGSIMTKHFT
ncbi:uncharacterized protein LOC128883131 isoform X11 [Hylaeus volcanicus]|uniref:uncharacterized protein LOC128883131 isoform X11 n=1 Tax=Hylaeus volcanicus TaxID=313075 RepID=UPI0023B82305|nr:uncharacterized protein LOC128883131 isoform X11 [Hylaeus volcanicus]